MDLDPETREAILEILEGMMITAQAMKTTVASMSSTVDRLLISSNRFSDVCSGNYTSESPNVIEANNIEILPSCTSESEISDIKECCDESMPPIDSVMEDKLVFHSGESYIVNTDCEEIVLGESSLLEPLVQNAKTFVENSVEDHILEVLHIDKGLQVQKVSSTAMNFMADSVPNQFGKEAAETLEISSASVLHIRDILGSAELSTLVFGGEQLRVCCNVSFDPGINPQSSRAVDHQSIPEETVYNRQLSQSPFPKKYLSRWVKMSYLRKFFDVAFRISLGESGGFHDYKITGSWLKRMEDCETKILNYGSAVVCQLQVKPCSTKKRMDIVHSKVLRYQALQEDIKMMFQEVEIYTDENTGGRYRITRSASYPSFLLLAGSIPSSGNMGVISLFSFDPGIVWVFLMNFRCLKFFRGHILVKGYSDRYLVLVAASFVEVNDVEMSTLLEISRVAYKELDDTGQASNDFRYQLSMLTKDWEVLHGILSKWGKFSTEKLSQQVLILVWQSQAANTQVFTPTEGSFIVCLLMVSSDIFVRFKFGAGIRIKVRYMEVLVVSLARDYDSTLAYAISAVFLWVIAWDMSSRSYYGYTAVIDQLILQGMNNFLINFFRFDHAPNGVVLPATLKRGLEAAHSKIQGDRELTGTVGRCEGVFEQSTQNGDALKVCTFCLDQSSSLRNACTSHHYLHSICPRSVNQSYAQMLQDVQLLQDALIDVLKLIGYVQRSCVHWCLILDVIDVILDEYRLTGDAICPIFKKMCTVVLDSRC